jgi:hypothetical protein
MRRAWAGGIASWSGRGRERVCAEGRVWWSMRRVVRGEWSRMSGCGWQAQSARLQAGSHHGDVRRGCRLPCGQAESATVSRPDSSQSIRHLPFHHYHHHHYHRHHRRDPFPRRCLDVAPGAVRALTARLEGGLRACWRPGWGLRLAASHARNSRKRSPSPSPRLAAHHTPALQPSSP